jgi:Tol biopolymer transport system component
MVGSFPGCLKRLRPLPIAAAMILPWPVGTAAESVHPDIHDTRSLAIAPATIVFVSQDGIWSVEPDGSDLVQLTHRANDRSPAWSPGRRAIAFVRAMTTSEGMGQLRVVGPDGSHARVISPRWPGEEPTWSSDGDRLAFYCGCDGAIHVMGADGSDDVRITDSRATRAPDWSPDGTTIAYGEPVGRWFHIFAIDPGGGSRTQLSHGSGSDAWPDWSPDGTRIVFSRWRPRRGRDLYVMQADGSDLIRLTRTPRMDEEEPSWSPDGRKIAFAGLWRGSDRTYLFTILSDGSGRVQVTTRLASEPAWSG